MFACINMRQTTNEFVMSLFDSCQSKQRGRTRLSEENSTLREKASLEAQFSLIDAMAEDSQCQALIFLHETGNDLPRLSTGPFTVTTATAAAVANLRVRSRQNGEMYEAIRREGASKGKAARIAQAKTGKSLKPGNVRSRSVNATCINEDSQ